ncbi:MAG: ATP-binding protein [Galactobacter sp.]
MSKQALFTDPQSRQYRLARVELINWGTFHGIASLDVARQGHLITGASGSGKSSLLDAIATVLTPRKWLRYNTAAQDAGTRGGDRTLMSYLRGAWSKQADDDEDTTVSQYLRRATTFSGLLLRYDYAAGDQGSSVTLARLFHVKGTSTDSSEIKDLAFATAGPTVQAPKLADLAPYARNGIDVRAAKHNFPDATITSTGSHSRYFGRLRREFKLPNDTALQLLHRTQAAKNLGSLDRLFRDYMLDEPETFATTATAVGQFVDLKEAHRMVVQARKQLEMLNELQVRADQFESSAAAADHAHVLWDSVQEFANRLGLDLARQDLERLSRNRIEARTTLDTAEEAVATCEEELARAEALVRDNGGERIEVERERLARAVSDAASVASRRADLEEELREVGIDIPADATEYLQLASLAQDANTPSGFTDAAEFAQRSKLQADLKETAAQLEALKGRRSNLDPRRLAARAQIAKAIGTSEGALPFSGELIDVEPEYSEWTGAIERVLRPLAQTMLVRTNDLKRVREFVNNHHLGTRLVFEEVPVRVDTPRPVGGDSLVHRIRVTDSPFAAWLQERLARRFDFTCVDSPNELGRHERAVTITGLVKHPHGRYEKDDRTQVQDTSTWVLGSDNEAKTERLITAYKATQQHLSAVQASIDRQAAEDAAARKRADLTRRLAKRPYSEVDVAAAESHLAEQRKALESLTQGNAPLEQALAAQRRAEATRAGAREHERECDRALARLDSQVDQLQGQVRTLSEQLGGTDLEAEVRDSLDWLFREHTRRPSRESLPGVAAAVTRNLSLQERAHRDTGAQAKAAFERSADRFCREFAEASADLTVNIDDRGSYRELRARIAERGLPEFEERFATMLRDRSRDVVAELLDEIMSAGRAVRERIEPVNASLARSPFDTGITLRIRVKESRGAEVNEFLSQLQSIASGSWTDGTSEQDLQAAEQRFAVLDSLMTRLGSSQPADEAWKRRCLDTREHMSFQALEVDESGGVVNVNDSSVGLSGGQRQRLVIFCLAAALRYQLVEDVEDRPLYSTIVLDEAFDKADSAYTRRALDVFREFGFHLLLATPQKLLSTIEPYIGGITVVSNPTRNRSQLAAVPWEEIGTHTGGAMPDGASPASGSTCSVPALTGTPAARPQVRGTRATVEAPHAQGVESGETTEEGVSTASGTGSRAESDPNDEATLW